MAQILNGSIDLTKIDKTKIKEVTKKDGTIAKYLDVSIFVNDSEDDYKIYPSNHERTNYY